MFNKPWQIELVSLREMFSLEMSQRNFENKFISNDKQFRIFIVTRY